MPAFIVGNEVKTCRKLRLSELRDVLDAAWKDRELTLKGLVDSKLITETEKNQKIHEMMPLKNSGQLLIEHLDNIFRAREVCEMVLEDKDLDLTLGEWKDLAWQIVGIITVKADELKKNLTSLLTKSV